MIYVLYLSVAKNLIARAIEKCALYSETSVTVN